MDDQSNPLADLTPPQLVERALDLHHEVTYWQTVLGDLGKIGDQLNAIVEPLISSTIAAGTLCTIPDERVQQLAGVVLESNGNAMPQLLLCLRSVLELIELANGRGLALDKTIAAISDKTGVPLDDDDESTES